MKKTASNTAVRTPCRQQWKRMATLLPIARQWFRTLYKRHRSAKPHSHWWALKPAWGDVIKTTQQILDGTYRFSPMHQYRFQGEVLRVWAFLDRWALRFLLALIRPTFPYILSKKCLHLKGMKKGVKITTRYVQYALKTNDSQYVIRGDINLETAVEPASKVHALDLAGAQKWWVSVFFDGSDESMTCVLKAGSTDVSRIMVADITNSARRERMRSRENLCSRK